MPNCSHTQRCFGYFLSVADGYATAIFDILLFSISVIGLQHPEDYLDVDEVIHGSRNVLTTSTYTKQDIFRDLEKLFEPRPAESCRCTIGQLGFALSFDGQGRTDQKARFDVKAFELSEITPKKRFLQLQDGECKDR
ncbi:hypothetical protein AJ78_04515 [Emergomyces pasteurianus Ep9510]|uniref:Uncharacterized protein n=1 Tax=Emergomyces pasteurianus Ep9510 TaxID=1447872 RepID=A0A1J9PFJ1_9EURO|nr:hypothetical protein AJ78_04515 [Emergomyces pasteurianus Ep9510]